MAKSLAKNSKPPQFMATDVFGKEVSLSAYKTKYILVVFLRYAGCPYCNLAIHRLSVEYSNLKKNDCDVIAFVQSNKENIVNNIYNRHAKRPKFSIVPDPDRNIYKKYGVRLSIKRTLKDITKAPYWVQAVSKYGFRQGKIDGNNFLVPAWFLINTDTNKIIKSEEGVSFYNDETFIDIYDSLIFKD